ncbi:ParB N-terminal domain-containing protein [Hyphomicrobium sp. NDB2Meth4]|uniref:ParB/RepB/Spo0J family partition protein n=1 Tax=Hyphomicrobium sp. NDB2Meth4 TaxID=1892846 RepID=UPI000931AA72|nr:ParB N-terminal domain-containing protein [Hyphomicrobium sp. NDB2Meth4]
MSKINLLAPTTIGVPDDRQPDPATVAALKASMAEIGLLNPILVQRYAGCGAQIVAGRNRLQAAIELGWDAINAIELPELNGGADAVAVGKLAEIAENLHRREISALERDELVVRWVALVAERKKGQTAPRCAGSLVRWEEGRPTAS